MAMIMKTVEKALAKKDLSIPELKTAKGAVALSERMDLLYEQEGHILMTSENIYYGATLLMKWLVSVPTDVFRQDGVGIPAVLERIRKTYYGKFPDGSNSMSLATLSAANMIAQWAFELGDKTWREWKLPFEIEKVKALRENGYAFDWFYFNAYQLSDLPDRPWCEALRFYPPKQFLSHPDFVWAAADRKRKDVLLCMKEVGFLTDTEITETMAKLKGENRALFLSVWYGDRGDKSPEIATVEDLLKAEKPDGETIALIVNGSPEVFREKLDLIKRALPYAPRILLFGDWSGEKDLYETAFAALEQYYGGDRPGYSMGYYTHAFLERPAKENKDKWLNAFKRLYPSDEEKRQFLKSHPVCAFKGGFFAACSKKLKDDFGFWINLYTLSGEHADLPVALKKNQTFLRMCQPVKPVWGFSEYFLYDSEEALDFALAHADVDLSDVPKELLSNKNIYRILENSSGNIDKVDFSLFSDEEFVVGAAAYRIDARRFFKRIEKPLRKKERVWQAWTTKQSIPYIWNDIPVLAKKTRAFYEHLLAIGEGVSFDNALFSQAWSNFPDLGDALENEYVKEVAGAKDRSDRPLGEAEQRRIAEDISDARLRENILKKFG